MEMVVTSLKESGKGLSSGEDSPEETDEKAVQELDEGAESAMEA